MLFDSLRAVGAVKHDEAARKYESTYRMKISELIPFGSDRKAYEARITEIIHSMRIRKDKDYFIASFPFFNRNNALVYDLLLCTGHIEGFKLFKKEAWRVFGGNSSNKNTHGLDRQMMLNFQDAGVPEDEDCYHVHDIARYIQMNFRCRKNVPLSEIWGLLDEHPIFPSEGFATAIKQELKRGYGAKVSRSTISFSGYDVE